MASRFPPLNHFTINPPRLMLAVKATKTKKMTKKNKARQLFKKQSGFLVLAL
jgi:hypothetical protein